MIGHVFVLNAFCDRSPVRSVHINFHFSLDCTYTISHVMVLSSLHHRSQLVRLVMIVLFHFRCRGNLYDWSRHCPVSFLSQITHYLIDLDTSISYTMEITPLRLVTCCPVQFFLLTASCLISYDNLDLILAQIVPIRSMTFLSCLVFIIDNALSDRSQ